MRCFASSQSERQAPLHPQVVFNIEYKIPAIVRIYIIRWISIFHTALLPNIRGIRGHECD